MALQLLPSPKRGHSSPTFRPVSIVAKRSPISTAAELLYCKLVLLYVEIYTPSDFAVVSRATDTGESFVDGLSSSALLQPSPAAAAAAGGVSVVDNTCWTNSVRRPVKSLPAASLRHCATLGPSRCKDRSRHVVPPACVDAGGPGAPRGPPPPTNWLDRRPLARLCRDDVRFVEKLGEGRFAEVRDRLYNSH